MEKAIFYNLMGLSLEHKDPQCSQAVGGHVIVFST